MVLSKINSSISYPELKKTNPEDSNMETDLYEISVKGVDVVIAVGNPRHDFQKKNVVYYPVYLVKKNNKVVQIGVYEIPHDTLSSYLDVDGDVDLEKLNDPLIYTFATKNYLENKRLLPPKEEKEDSDDKEIISDEEDEDEYQDKGVKTKSKKESIETGDGDIIPEIRSDIFILTKGVSIPVPLEEESKKDAKDIREKYKDSKEHNWVQKFMKNPYYDLIDNEGGGDCLFATIRDAFSSIAQQTSVAKIRTKLADQATNEVFVGYQEMFDMYNNSLITDTAKIKDLSKNYVVLKDKFSNVLDRNEQKLLVNNAKKVKTEHDNLVREKKITAEMMSEYKFMKGIDSLEKFKKVIQSCEFWGETWAISTLERVLNIKFILLSAEANTAKDNDNVLNCGQLNDSILQDKGYFNPDFYIIVEYNGWHYRLVSYKDKQIFTFPEIPYDIKKLIVDKCLERNAGPFSLIKDFKELKKRHPNSKSAADEAVEIDVEELTEAKLRGTYDDDVVFSFYSKSASKLPGKGSGEKIPKEYVKEYTALATIPDWRKKLANTWPQPFTLDNHKWTSVEHYYQASKFKKDNPEYYLSFSLDSGTDLSQSVEMASAAGGKTGKYKGDLIRPKQVKVDPDFFGERSQKELREAQYAKFTQNPDLQQLLLATKTAKLVEHKRGKPSDVYEELMLIRDELAKQSQKN
tara:strand:- start:8680 stop:10746 length:2067 start_codon:yes stop_codon:yes gene_type:complete